MMLHNLEDIELLSSHLIQFICYLPKNGLSESNSQCQVIVLIFQSEKIIQIMNALLRVAICPCLECFHFEIYLLPKNSIFADNVWWNYLCWKNNKNRLPAVEAIMVSGLPIQMANKLIIG